MTKAEPVATALGGAVAGETNVPTAIVAGGAVVVELILNVLLGAGGASDEWFWKERAWDGRCRCG